MKRAILGVCLSLLLAVPALAAPAAPACRVVTKAAPGLTIHSFVAPRERGAFATQILEGSQGLVLINLLQAPEDGNELQAFIKSLNKPVRAILLTRGGAFNWAPLQRYAGVPVYALKDVVDVMMAKRPKTLPTMPQALPEDENTVAGIRMRVLHPLPNAAKAAELVVLPQQKAIVLHGFGGVGLHMPMGESLARNTVLKAVKDNGFTWIMTTNGMPGGAEVLDILGGYNATVDTILRTAKTPEEAKAQLVAAYPEWRGDDVLDRMLPILFAMER